MDEREMFEAAYRKRYPTTLKRDSCGIYISSIVRLSWEFWQAARRTTPDMEAIIEQCAKLVENEYGLMSVADHVRSLKTAPLAIREVRDEA